MTSSRRIGARRGLSELAHFTPIKRHYVAICFTLQLTRDLALMAPLDDEAAMLPRDAGAVATVALVKCHGLRASIDAARHYHLEPR